MVHAFLSFLIVVWRQRNCVCLCLEALPAEAGSLQVGAWRAYFTAECICTALSTRVGTRRLQSSQGLFRETQGTL